MKNIFIAGNWKSNKTVSEVRTWVDGFVMNVGDIRSSMTSATVIVCAPFTALQFFHDQISLKSLPLKLAAQNISPFAEGAYTGEVTANMAHEFADWVLLGHSERRKYFNETDELLKTKVELAHTAGLKVIYCVPDEKTVVPAGVDVVGYEPIWAIGTGKTDTPENANGVVDAIKKATQVKTVIYGGSVTADNVASFVKQPAIDGVLPGGASLDPVKYTNLVRAALTAGA